jgi:hypothetical protein
MKPYFSLCPLCALCASVVNAYFSKIHYRDTENTAGGTESFIGLQTDIRSEKEREGARVVAVVRARCDASRLSEFSPGGRLC